MKVLQLDVNRISFELVKPEASIYEDSKQKRATIENALALLLAIEKGDGEETARKAVDDAVAFAKKQKLSTIVLYPFAHISNNLESPGDALPLFKKMEAYAKSSFEGKVESAPFGWNKQLSIDIKGYPLAEQSRSYGKGAADSPAKRVKHAKTDLSILKKADWSGLPSTDHRAIGEKLDLFSFQEVSPGMVYWHHNGMVLFKELLKFIREKLDENDYLEVATPAVANLALWHASGHMNHYRDNMFTMDSEKESLGLKPMNCPSVILLYKSRRWSYRELPLRLADFDKIYRNEISGALTGLFRVREITQDDAHIFLAEEQLEAEIAAQLNLVNYFYKKFGLSYKAKLSTMPDDHLGSEALWDKAVQHLRNALDKNSIKYETKEKEGAFYGPKIDIDISDSIGREWQCATIQVDYQMPQRFGLTYVGQDGKEYTPVIVHRVIYGSLERFLGVLIEHIRGKFPTWMAPVQVSVLSISEKANTYAKKVYEELRHSNLRVSLNISDRTLDYKIREAKEQEIPYTIIVGSKEQEKQTISIRDRAGEQAQGVKTGRFVELILKEVGDREGNADMLSKLK